MSRPKNYRYLLRAPLVVLPFFFACGSSPSKPPSTAADKTDAADSSASDADSDADDAADGEEKGKKSDADKAESKDDAKQSAKAEDDDDDDKPPVDDSRTTASIANVIKEHRKGFKKCYEDVRKQQPDLKGNVLLKIVLDGAGSVKKAYVDDESSIRDTKVTDCMIKLAKSLTYPKSSKGLDKDFEYDFGFNNQTK